MTIILEEKGGGWSIPPTFISEFFKAESNTTHTHTEGTMNKEGGRSQGQLRSK